MVRRILMDSFLGLKLIGLNPFKDNVKSVTTFLLMPTIILLIAAIMEITHLKKFDVDFAALFTETLAVVLQGVIRFVTFAIYHKKILKIAEQFDELKAEFTFNKKLNLTNDLVSKNARIGLVLYRLLCFIIGGISSLKVFIFADGSFSYFIYRNEDISQSPYFELIELLEIVYHYIAVIIYIETDIMFAALTIELLMHLKNLQNSLKDLDFEKIWNKRDEKSAYNKIGRRVYYHIKLLRIGKELNKMFSFLLVTLIIGITLEICVGLYTLIYDGSIYLPRMVISFSKLMGYNLEFYIYCHLGTWIHEEFLGVGDAAYESGWENRGISRINKSLMIIIQVSHIEFNFTILGVVILNLANYITVLRMTFSLYTVLQQVKG